MPESQRFPYIINNSEWAKQVYALFAVDSQGKSKIRQYFSVGRFWCGGKYTAVLSSLLLLENLNLCGSYLHGQGQMTSPQFWGRLIFLWNSKFVFIACHTCLK